MDRDGAARREAQRRPVWAGIGFALVLAAVAIGARTLPMPPGPADAVISLDPALLPYYALCSTARLIAALGLSAVLTLVLAPAAAKSRRLGMVLLPILDVLQSIPVLALLGVTAVLAPRIAPGPAWPHLAAIVTIATAMAWGMVFSLVQSLRAVPPELAEAARLFRLRGWQRFWRLELPYAAPPLLWNTMAVLSAAWFYVVASETVTVGPSTWRLPGMYGLLHTLRIVFGGVGWREVVRVVGLGGFTLLRVLGAVAVASVIWVPIGVWAGMRPRVARVVRPAVQVLSAFPANIAFPLLAAPIVLLQLDADIWVTALFVLGAQWTLLLNVMAGAQAMPGDWREAGRSFGVRGVVWWRRIAGPAVLPYYATGARTAAGGAWNAAIVAEVARWGTTSVDVHGIGAYVAAATAAADAPRLLLGIFVISRIVMLVNMLLWTPLNRFALRRATS